MTILNCECGNEIFIMDETEATAWQCEQCGQWYDFFGVKVPDPASVQPKSRLILSTGVQARICKAKRRGSADGTRARNCCFNCAVLP